MSCGIGVKKVLFTTNPDQSNRYRTFLWLVFATKGRHSKILVYIFADHVYPRVLLPLGCTQVRIQDSEAEICRCSEWSFTSEASYVWPTLRAYLRALEAFGVLMLKYAFSHILETLFLSFLHLVQHQS